MQQYIAGRYAQSLYEVCADKLEKDVGDFLALLRESDFLSSPRITTSVKMYVIDKLALPEKLKNLGKILLLNHRGPLCVKVLLEYIEIVKKNRGEADARIESYNDLSTKAQKTVTAALLTKFPALKKVNIIPKVNPSLLGGLTVKMNSIMIDLSIGGRLEKYKNIGRSAVSEMVR